MSAAAIAPTSSGSVPADVRAAGPDAVKGYRAALSFERLLLSKLLSEALPESEGEEPRAASMSDTLADAIVSAGGAGIATDLYGETGARR